VGVRRVYDAALATWMTPDLTALPKVSEEPRVMNVYAFGDPYKQDIADYHMQGE
jgi:hypothetical protein